MLIGTCAADRLVVSCGSHFPFQQESQRCVLCVISSIGWAVPEPTCRSLILYLSCILSVSGRTPFPGRRWSALSSGVSPHGFRKPPRVVDGPCPSASCSP